MRRRDARPRGLPPPVPARASCSGARPASWPRPRPARRCSSAWSAYAERELASGTRSARDHAAHARVGRRQPGARVFDSCVDGRASRRRVALARVNRVRAAASGALAVLRRPIGELCSGRLEGASRIIRTFAQHGQRHRARDPVCRRGRLDPLVRPHGRSARARHDRHLHRCHAHRHRTAQWHGDQDHWR